MTVEQSLHNLNDELLAETLEEIAKALRETVAMPRSAEAVSEAARRLKEDA
jgi:hypothetical protein